MEIKKKFCWGCEDFQYIFKNYEGRKYCKTCWNRIKPKKEAKPPAPINKVSDKKKEQDKEYKILRLKFLLQNPYCQVKLPGCLINSTDIHHLFFGADRSSHYIDDKTWKSTCRYCHHMIHDVLSNEELIELGLRLKE